MRLLIDSDSICYQAGFSANNEGEENLARWQVGQIVDRIVAETNCQTYKLFLSGSGNFRYDIYPDYKGTRKNLPRPMHLQAMREHLVVKYGATISDGNEADDELGIVQCASTGTAIAAIDKDLLMIPGLHYNYNKKTWLEQSELNAMRHFFYQLIMGDKADNIPSFDGIMRTVVPKKLQATIDYLYETDSIDEMLEHVYSLYSGWAAFNLSASCLWIQRKEHDSWQEWQNQELIEALKIESTTEEHGQEEGSILSSLPSSEVEADDRDWET